MNTLVNSSDKLEVKTVDVNEACPTNHYFSDGVYTREIFMPAGLLVIGKTHKTRHLNVVLTGSCDVMINGEIQHIQAPYTFESLEGSQKTLYIHEDCKWMTIHVNEDDETNLEILEERYIDADDIQPKIMMEKIKDLEGGTNELGDNSSCGSNYCSTDKR